MMGRMESRPWPDGEEGRRSLALEVAIMNISLI